MGLALGGDGVYSFNKVVFRHEETTRTNLMFSVPLGVSRPLRAPSGGELGAPKPAQGHGHFEAGFQACFAAAGGQPSEPQSVKHDVGTCGKPSLRKACFQQPS